METSIFFFKFVTGFVDKSLKDTARFHYLQQYESYISAGLVVVHCWRHEDPTC